MTGHCKGNSGAHVQGGRADGCVLVDEVRGGLFLRQGVSVSRQSGSSICLGQFQYPFPCMALFYIIIL